MNARPTLERRVTDWLQAEAPARAPERVLAITLDRVAVVGQERTLPQWRRNDRPGPNRALLIAATVALIAILAAGALFVGSQIRVREAPVPVPTLLSPAPAVRALGNGPTLTWSRSEVLPPREVRLSQASARVAWLGDRFVLVDEQTQTVASSPDGSAWTTLLADDPTAEFLLGVPFGDPMATWQGDIVSWSPTNPGAGLRLRLSPGPTFTAGFEGNVDAVGIGPEGIVVSTHVPFDQGAFIESVLGPTWGGDNLASWGLQDGILSLGARDGRTATIVLADHGLDEATFDNRGEGWHSVDGKEWAPIPGYPGKVSSIVGTAEGFFARGDPGTGLRMFHSADGFTWQRMAVAYDMSIDRSIDPVILPWGASVLQTDGTHYWEAWTAAGKRDLPMAAEVRASATSLPDESGIGAGPLGVVSVDADADEILYSPDGVDWRIQPMSAEMAQAGRFIGRPHSTMTAVGSDAVVILLWAGGTEEGYTPSVWVGIPTP